MNQASPRIADLLAKMTIKEKVGQLNLGPDETKVDPDLIRAGGLGAVICSSSAFAGNDRQERVRVPVLNALQKIAKEESRLGIPILVGRDVIHGHRTVAPIPLAQAASWSPADVRRASEVAAGEAFADGIRWIYTPMLDIARDPRWGRVAEGYGEDPYLCSALAKECIVGLQRGHLPAGERIAACAKHYVGYGAAEGGRDYNTGEISAYTMRNIYMPSFRAAIDAGVASIMTCFNDLGGMPVTCDGRLLREVLRDEWGFGAVTVSDWNAVFELVKHGVAADDKAAAMLALTAGVDMDMASECYLRHVEELIAEGQVSEEHLDEAVLRVLSLKEDLGLFENPYTDEGLSEQAHRTPENRAAVLELARKTPVLLKNNGILPLGPGTKKIGLFGPLVEERTALLGTWCLDGEPADVTTVHEAFSQVLGTGTESLPIPWRIRASAWPAMLMSRLRWWGNLPIGPEKPTRPRR